MVDVFWQCHGRQSATYFWIQKLRSGIAINMHTYILLSQRNYWLIDTSSCLLIIMSLLGLSQLFEISTQALAIRSFSPLHTHTHRGFFLCFEIPARASQEENKVKSSKQAFPCLSTSATTNHGGESLLEWLGTYHKRYAICNFWTEYLWQYIKANKQTGLARYNFNWKSWIFQLLFPSTCRFSFQPLWEVIIGLCMEVAGRSSWS